MNEILNAVGVLAEMCGLMRDNLMRNGFTREEAVAMATYYLLAVATQNKKEE